jgi:hypothetical protein
VSAFAVATSRQTTIPSAQKQGARGPRIASSRRASQYDFSHVAPFHLSDTTAAEAKRQTKA